MKLRHPCKCVKCGDMFEPDPRNAGRQKACRKPACKAALKVVRDRKWLAKNPDYHRGPIHVARVKAWKQAHPGHSSRSTAKATVQDALATQPADYSRASATSQSASGDVTAKVQDALSAQPVDLDRPFSVHAASSDAPTAEVQDALSAQDFVLIGLIAHLSDSKVQDAVLQTRQHLLQLGLDVLSGKHVGASK
jgi:hypothetical protein